MDEVTGPDKLTQYKQEDSARAANACLYGSEWARLLQPAGVTGSLTQTWPKPSQPERMKGSGSVPFQFVLAFWATDTKCHWGG